MILACGTRSLQEATEECQQMVSSDREARHISLSSLSSGVLWRWPFVPLVVAADGEEGHLPGLSLGLLLEGGGPREIPRVVDVVVVPAVLLPPQQLRELHAGPDQVLAVPPFPVEGEKLGQWLPGHYTVTG